LIDEWQADEYEGSGLYKELLEDEVLIEGVLNLIQ
jgi:hypothetical protein